MPLSPAPTVPPPPAVSERTTKTASRIAFKEFDSPEHWSGRGQHAEFSRKEALPLEEGQPLGRGAFADVHEVKCKGITLARKQIYCTRRMKIEDVKRELDILKRVDHRHVVTLVGSYTQNRIFGLLLHPAAVCDLGVFLDELDDEGRKFRHGGQDIGEEFVQLLERLRIPTHDLTQAYARLRRAYGCLTSAVQYLYDNNIRHKDIKPRNILLDYAGGLFITDFGISRDNLDASSSVTNGIERGTYKYCAPEVARYEPRGRAADVFSLGCVFLEMHTVQAGLPLVKFDDFRRVNEDHSFQNSPSKLREWMGILRVSRNDYHGVFHLLDIVEKMVLESPAARPIISLVQKSLEMVGGSQHLYHGQCCVSKSPEQKAYDALCKFEDYYYDKSH